jgi:hypothetical protein
MPQSVIARRRLRPYTEIYSHIRQRAVAEDHRRKYQQLAESVRSKRLPGAPFFALSTPGSPRRVPPQD